MQKSRQLASNGFVIVPDLLAAQECTHFADRAKRGVSGSGGTRSLLGQDWCRSLAAHLHQHVLLAPLLRPDFLAVQCTYFEKSASHNWLVAVHQDLSIPVARRIEHPALSGWSEKEGGLFVQAPAELLAQMLAVRLHLDDCTKNDGPLRVIPGSHLMGKISAEAASAIRLSSTEFVCSAARGSVMVMRPLLLHASSKSTGVSMRKVLHFLFGPPNLPFGLRWQDAAKPSNPYRFTHAA